MRSTWGPASDALEAPTAVPRGAVLVPQQQDLLRAGGRVWHKCEPLEGLTATPEPNPNAWSGLRAAAPSANLGPDRPPRQMGQWHMRK